MLGAMRSSGKLGFVMLAWSDVHGLEHTVSEMADPTAEDLSPRNFARDTNSSNGAAVARLCYCSLAVKATAR